MRSEGFPFDKGSLEIDCWAPGLCTWSVVLGQEICVWTCSISSTFSSYKLVHTIKTHMIFLFKAQFWKSNLQNLYGLKIFSKSTFLRFNQRCIFFVFASQEDSGQFESTFRNMWHCYSVWLHNLHSRNEIYVENKYAIIVDLKFWITLQHPNDLAVFLQRHPFNIKNNACSRMQRKFAI